MNSGFEERTENFRAFFVALQDAFTDKVKVGV